MDWRYIIAYVMIVLLINVIAANANTNNKAEKKKKRKEKTGTKAPRGEGQRVNIRGEVPRGEGQRITTCGNCGAEVRRVSVADQTVLYGSLIQECPHCHQKYTDLDYHELVLEGEPSAKARFEAGDRQLEQAASMKRLSDSGYIHCLYISDYIGKSPRNAQALRDLAIHRVKPLFERMKASTDLHFGEFRVSNAVDILDHLNYEAHDVAAVNQVVREVMIHYGIRPGTVSVQVDYATEHLPKEGGTLGTFSPSGDGGVVRIVMDPTYSEYDTVVSVILHECAHAFLHLRNIRYPDNNENERFTDLAAIYMGGGNYILRGNFPSANRRVGYLSQVECEEAQKLAIALRESWAKQDAETRRQADTAWRTASDELKALMASIEAVCKELHPGRVIREASIQNQFQAMWVAQEDKRHQAASLLNRTGGNMKNEALQRAAAEARTLANDLRPFDAVLKEWRAAEVYQASLPGSTLATAQGIGPLVAQGNAFALLEMMRFWHGCPATHRDAEVYYNRLLAAGDGASLCALGLCSQEGICIPRDEARARAYFQRAAELGSADAVRLLGGS